MKLAILADSTALPRGEAWGNIPFEKTYPYLLERKLRERFHTRSPLVLIHGKRMRTTVEVLQDWFEEVELRRCDFVVVQVGGGDCAPRFLRPKEKAWLESWPSERLRKMIRLGERHFRSRYISTFPLRVCVAPELFRNNVKQIIEKAHLCGVKKTVFVNVPCVSDAVERELPGSREQANRYNAILAHEADRAGVDVVDLHSLIRHGGGPDRLTVDGTHPNAEGLERLARELYGVLAPAVERSLASSEAALW